MGSSISPTLRAFVVTTVFVLVAGLSVLARLHFASAFYGNYDQQSYEIVAGTARRGGNVYAETNGRYNYSPFWARNLQLLDAVHRITQLPFHTVVRSYLTLVDVATACLIFLLARKRRASPFLCSALFLANPVSLYVTGYHGSFDNLALLPVIGLLLFLHDRDPASWKTVSICGLLLATSIWIKHITVFVPLFLAWKFPGWKRRLTFVALCYSLLAVSLAPHYLLHPQPVRDYVLFYADHFATSGVTSLLEAVSDRLPPPRAYRVFIAGVMLVTGFLLRRAEALQSCTVAMLLLLVLLPVFANQYLVWPVALGAVAPGAPYLTYLVFAASFLFGPSSMVGLPVGEYPGLPDWLDWASFANLSSVWAVALLWLATGSVRSSSRAPRAVPESSWHLAGALLGAVVLIAAFAGSLPASRSVVYIACDNNCCIWVDGEMSATVDRWEAPAEISLPDEEDRHLIAVEATNLDGAGGLIGVLRGHGDAEHSADWRCSKTAADGWHLPSFDDRRWSRPSSSIPYGEGVWGVRAGLELEGGEWVWIQDPPAERDTIHCRWWVAPAR